MKKSLLVAILMIFTLTGISYAGQGKGYNVEPYASCKPYTRWWWFTDKIEKKDIREQLIWAKEVGLGGVEIAWLRPRSKAARNNPIQGPEWLSPEWADVVSYAKRCADSLGLGCDYTYGSLWPFMDPDLPERFGSRKYGEEVSPAKRGGGWWTPRRARVLDHLNKKAFNWYAKHMDKGFKEAYKGSTSALFVDSWEINPKYLWTHGFENKFYKKFGYRIEPFMERLYKAENRGVFYDYSELLGELAIENFYKPFTAHAHKVNAITRAQCNGSPTDLLSAYMAVDIPETEALLYEPNFGRIAASAAALADKKAVSAETFTCLYGFRPRIEGRGPYMGLEQVADMRLIADALLANGTNQIVWHGMPYNKMGSLYQHFYASVHLASTAYFVDQLKDFNDYMALVSSYMRRGRTYSDIAVYLPIEDEHQVLGYPVNRPQYQRVPGTQGRHQLRYIWAPEYLSGYQPLWVNREVLSKAKVVNGCLVYNNTSFSALVIDVKFVNIASLRHILRLAKAGLPVVVARNPKQPGHIKSDEFGTLLNELMALPNVSQKPENVLKSIKRIVEGENLPEFWCREENGDKYIFFANPAACKMHYPLRYCQAFEDQGSVRDVVINTSKGAKSVRLEFKPNESLLMKVSKSGEVEFIDLKFKAKRIEGKGTFGETSADWDAKTKS